MWRLSIKIGTLLFEKQGTYQSWVQHDVRKHSWCLNVKIRPTVLILLRVILALCSSGQYHRKHICAATGFEGGRRFHAELIWLGGLPFYIGHCMACVCPVGVPVAAKQIPMLCSRMTILATTFLRYRSTGSEKYSLKFCINGHGHYPTWVIL